MSMEKPLKPRKPAARTDHKLKSIRPPRHPRPPAVDEATVLAISSPAGFAFVATRNDAEPYVPADFHFAMAEGIVDVEVGRLELLVIQLPVQHGKSMTASQWGIAWALGRHPTWNVIAATYNTDFAEDKIGRPTRDILERHGQRYFNVKIDQRSRSMKRWNTTAGGGLVAAGVERPVAGRPADLYVIDDPYPGIAEAMNPKFRAEVWQWFQVNIIPRRKPVLRMIAIMSRWHEDDFIAQLVRHAKESGWKHRVLDFPAIATCRVEGCDAPQLGFERPDPAGTVSASIEVCEHGVRDELGRLPGEALWPQVRNIEFLKRQLLDVGGTRMFMALYQGRPQQAGGSTFRQEWFRYFDRYGDTIRLLDQGGAVIKTWRLGACRVFQVVDLAAGDTQTLRSGITRTKSKRDFTVIGTFALTPSMELAILDVYRDDKLEGPDQIKLVAQLRAKYEAPHRHRGGGVPVGRGSGSRESRSARGADHPRSGKQRDAGVDRCQPLRNGTGVSSSWRAVGRCVGNRTRAVSQWPP
jgi:hypothetical protein